MSQTVEIWIGENAQPVGMLSFNEQGNRRAWSTFSYADAWLERTDRFAISPDLPLLRTHFNKKAESTNDRDSPFHYALQDTEPDGWARRVILRDFTKQRKDVRTQKQALSRLDYLLWVDDISRVGALRFRDESGAFLRDTPPGSRGVPPFIELAHILQATRAVELNKETQADLDYLCGKATSLGGMRPKSSILDEAGKLCIGKFPSVSDERSVTKGEVLAMRLAALAGINAAQARIVTVAGAPVALIRRFDRADGKRIPYLSAASLLMADDAQDHSYTEIVDVLREHSPTFKHDANELWRRVVFNMLINNVDDHLRNHGFLHEGGGRWRLSPAFDINPFPDKARELKTWLTEDSGPTARIAEAMEAAPYFSLTKAEACLILAKVVRSVKQWRKVSAIPDIGMTGTEQNAFESAFEHEGLQEAARFARG